MACWKRKVLKSEHSEEIARIEAKKFFGKNAPRFSFSLTEDGLSIYGAIFLRISGLVWFSSFSFLFYAIFFSLFVVHQRNLRRIARKRTVEKRWKRYIIVGIADAICLPYYLVFLVHATKTLCILIGMSCDFDGQFMAFCADRPTETQSECDGHGQ